MDEALSIVPSPGWDHGFNGVQRDEAHFVPARTATSSGFSALKGNGDSFVVTTEPDEGVGKADGREDDLFLIGDLPADGEGLLQFVDAELDVVADGDERRANDLAGSGLLLSCSSATSYGEHDLGVAACFGVPTRDHVVTGDDPEDLSPLRCRWLRRN